MGILEKGKPGLRLIACVLAAISIAAIFSRESRASLLDKLEWKAEKHFGRSAREQIQEEYGFIENPLLTSWVNEIGVSMSSISHRSDIPYEFNIVDTGEVNAFAAPGGYVFVTRGLIERVDEDDELANVLGHEIGHISARHGAKNIKKIPLIIAGMNILYSKGEAAGRIGGMALSLLQLHYSREDEYEADKLGVQYSDKAGFDPGGMTSFFKKLEQRDRSGELNKLEVSLMSHPKTANRIGTIASYPQLDSADPVRFVRVGDRYRERFLYNNAIEQYEAALKLDPASSAAMNGLGVSNMELGNRELARKYFNDTLKLAPGDKTAADALARLDAEESETPESIALASAQDAKAARDALSGAVMTLQNHLDVLFKSKDKAKEQTLALNTIFDRRLDSFSTTAQRISDSDILRLEVLQGSGLIFSSVFNALAETSTSADDMVELAQDSLRRGRIALFRLERGKVTPQMAAHANALAETLLHYDNTLPEINRDLVNSLEQAEFLFNNTARAMNELSDTLNENDENILALRMRVLMDGINDSAADVMELETAAGKVRDTIDDCETKIRRASLNLSALSFTAPEENIFKKMFARRFKTPVETIDAMASAGLGYGDILALRARAASENIEPAAMAEKFEKSKKTIDDFLFKGQPESAAPRDRSLDVLYALAEMDIRSITRDKKIVELTSPSDLAPGEKITSVEAEQIENDPALSSAFELIKQGAPEKAAEIIHNRGREKSATAPAHKLLGLSYKLQGAYDEALEEFKSACRKDSGDAQAHFFAANAFLELERYEDALNEYRSTLKIAPDYGAAHIGAGFALVMLGKTPEAETELLDAVRSGAEPAVSSRNIALFYYSQGRYYEAVDYFDASLKADPNQKELEKIASRLR